MPGEAGAVQRAGRGSRLTDQPSPCEKLPGSHTGSLDLASTELTALVWLPGARSISQAAASGHH